jgi:hypothetical protein
MVTIILGETKREHQRHAKKTNDPQETKKRGGES